jgi:hypothetical protein
MACIPAESRCFTDPSALDSLLHNAPASAPAIGFTTGFPRGKAGPAADFIALVNRPLELRLSAG